MVAKKGSKAWKAKLSKAQKLGWAKRKKAQADEYVKVKPAYEEEQVAAIVPSQELRESLKRYHHSTTYSNAGVDPGLIKAATAYADRWQPNAATQQSNLPKPGDWRRAEDIAAGRASAMDVLNKANINPKTLASSQKVPVLSVVPPASIIAQAIAMRYGAFLAPKVDGTRGYGPYNWRDQPIEAHVYIDAAMRHLMQWWDGDEYEIIRDDEGRAIDKVSHLASALATIGILIDAKANDTMIDNRPQRSRMVATNMLNDHKLPRYDK
jgi:hypothetical protein